MARTDLVTHSAKDLQALAAAVDDGIVERIGRGMVQAMAEGLPDIDFDADLTADALAACWETGGHFFAGLATEPWMVPPVPPPLSDLARTLARRGAEVAVLIKTTRLAQSVFWPAVMESAERAIDDPSARMRALTITFERFGEYLEGLLDGAIVIFQEERDRTMRGAHARRNETIQALLKGHKLDVDGASRVLGYELRRWHTALTLSEPTADHDALERLEAIVGDAAKALAASTSLTTTSGSRGLWVWLATYEPPAPEQVDALKALAVPAGVLVAVGQAAPGTAGFRRSHEDAMAAQRVVLARGASDAVTPYADVEIVSLLSSNDRAARALVARELGGLVARDRQSATLRETVLAFLRCGNSATAAGRDLQVHTNTVRYRIEKAEEILGRPLQGQQLQLQLQLALMLVATLGDGFLPDDA
jgi:DNA-binding PucR family transcriptional regulator